MRMRKGEVGVCVDGVLLHFCSGRYGGVESTERVATVGNLEPALIGSWRQEAC